MTQASDPNIAAKVQHLNNGDSLIIKSAAGTASAGTESVEWIAIGT